MGISERMTTNEIADLVVEAADRIIVPRFRSLGGGEVMEKTPGDYVTIADQEAEAYLTERLLAAYPDSVILGEEATAADPNVRERYATASHGWVMDPIDGTKNFINGSPDYAVMLAETVDGTVARSWIWQPAHERMYVAERGNGVTLNGQSLHMQPAKGKPYHGVSDPPMVGESAGGVAHPAVLRTMCAGVDYPDLTAGLHDFIFYIMGDTWDHLPGLGMLTEMGGVIRTDSGEPYVDGTDYKYLISARSMEVWDDLQRGMDTARG